MFRMVRIEPPEWATQPDLNIASVKVAEFSKIQQFRSKMLQTVHNEIEHYVNDDGLVFCDNSESFPLRRRLTGSYYIGSESYFAHRNPDWFQISIKCHCTEPPKKGVERDDDYLGLEVWLKCIPGKWSSFEVFRNTDSSSI